MRHVHVCMYNVCDKLSDVILKNFKIYVMCILGRHDTSSIDSAAVSFRISNSRHMVNRPVGDTWGAKHLSSYSIYGAKLS